MYTESFSSRSYDYLRELLLAVANAERAEEYARALLERYGTIETILAANISDLEDIAGKNAAMLLKISAHVTGRRSTDKMQSGRVYSQREICEYLKALFIADSEEKIYAVTFGKDGEYISTHLVSHGTVNTTEVTPRTFAECAINDRAARIIVAHNHPGGTTLPSADDIRFTGKLASVFSVSGVEFLYHVIVAGQEARILRHGDVL